MGEGAAGQIARLSAFSGVSMHFPFSAFAMLQLFAERKIELTERQFDLYFDEVLAVLEKANDQKFRFTPKGESEAP